MSHGFSPHDSQSHSLVLCQLSYTHHPRPARRKEIIRIAPCAVNANYARVWGAYDLSGLVAHSLSGFHGYRGGDHETGGMAAGGPDETIRGSVRRMAGATAFAGGGGPDPGGIRPHVPPLRRAVRRRGAGCPPRSADLPGIPPPGARG